MNKKIPWLRFPEIYLKSWGNDQNSIPGRGRQIILFTIASRPLVGPTQPHVKWVAGAFSPWVKRRGRDSDQSTLSSAEVKKV